MCVMFWLPVTLAQEKILPGHTVFERYHSPLPHTYVEPHELPKAFSWHNVDGISYLTKSLNQHIPQYVSIGFTREEDANGY